MPNPISVPFAGQGASFDAQELVACIKLSGRKYIIQGQQACALADRTKPHSLDMWLRWRFPDHENTKLADNAVIDTLVATGKFRKGTFKCPDSGELCKGIKLA